MLMKNIGLQRKMAWFKIPNFMFYIILFSAILYLAEIVLRINTKNISLYSILEFKKEAVLKGEVWRVFSYVFLIPKAKFVFAFIYIYALNFVSNSLEVHWGAANLTIYYFLGYVLNLLVGFIAGTTNIVFLNLSLIFVFCEICPNMNLNLFSFINFRTSWLGYLTTALFLIKLAISSIVLNLGNLLTELASIALFLLLFGPGYFINQFKKLKQFMNRQRF